ncbi:SHUGOSHIN 1-like [Forsythia ovata]|uniref:SHUGOSHIN 1-like n=1 Tax=Forsythia ovata TaxID=205694 RepID=A0ABD1WGS5_9LAMI
MEGFVIPDSKKYVTIAEKATKPCLGSVPRRKLADISNLMEKYRPSNQEEKFKSMPSTTKEYNDQLQKENMALVNMMAQRNKIIEQSGVELDRLRVNLLKMQEQNQQFAVSNNQMLMELNLGKDRLKALQHELGCKNGLLIARKLELKERARTRPCQNDDMEVKLIKCKKPGESSKEGGNDEIPHNTKRSLQSNSLVSSKQFESMDKAENKRSYERRQSARFKAEEVKPIDNLSEIDDRKTPVCPLLHDPVKENGSTSTSASLENDGKKCSLAPGSEAQEIVRLSLCRPSRQAAKKVQSYKEIPVNVKMRRTD